MTITAEATHTGERVANTPGLAFSRYFTREAGDAEHELRWELRTASITDANGSVIFEQQNVLAPASWSQTATNIVASKYFHGRLGAPAREHSVGQLVARVVDTIAKWGREDGYFDGPESAANFRLELAHLLLHQKASFNSPVWFNVGVSEPRGYGFVYDREQDAVRPLRGADNRPQCSACFINSVADRMESILDLAKTEGMLFKYGSGSGVNLSTLREEDAPLSGGGRASGPLSFMKGLDAFAGVIKSGGKTRRAAKMVVLNADHPDIEKFIWCKAKEEKKAHTLIDAGYDSSLDGDAYSSIFFQNANNSVRVPDEFMRAIEADGNWSTRSVSTGQPVKTYKARDLLRQIAEAAHQCGDPGLQFDTTINDWHTSKVSGRINASNPCSEYFFLDDSACNLSSLNLLKFLTPGGRFDVAGFRHSVDTLILAQEILVDRASYPTAKIAQNSHDFRPLGLGYANLGALLMALGLPYDSDSGRALAAAVTAILGGQAYLTSARIAQAIGCCAGFPQNRETFLQVVNRHGFATRNVEEDEASCELLSAARECWREAYSLGSRVGFRNAQTTVLAPTGTIGFMMDCDTTGIEPELALVKHKKLVGGGSMRIVNGTVSRGLHRLGYTAEQVEAIVHFIDETGTIEGAPCIKDQDLAVFDSSLRPHNGKRSIDARGHIRMMAALQPFLSGGISKTINMPEESTVDDVLDAYVESWRLGLKAVAIYRDGSKRVQPLSAGNTVPPQEKGAPAAMQPLRRKLPDERSSMTHKFSIAGHEGYITVGLYPDNTPGEIFISMNKAGSTISGLMDTIAVSVSTGLQYGVPLSFFVDKFSHVRFEPSGWTGNQQLPYAKSIIDYLFRWLGKRFLGRTDPAEVGDSMGLRPTEAAPQQALAFEPVSDAPLCSECGGIMTRNGSCYKCDNCGGTSGCS
ncbi:MAG TPA: vitamin B12-dependent ribonucleotide reductase [Bryobacteraceae bacterium]|nr:vitamin B12-dependent ribonucleotide reductase [Bryobacteraceae bacterium]